MNTKMGCMAAALIGATTAFADVLVTDVKVQPRSPWNGLVDIDYTIASDTPEADVYVNPVAYDGDRRVTLFPSTLTGDGAETAVKAGKHRMTWNSQADLGVFSSAHFQIKMYAGKRLPRYMRIDLSSGSESDSYPVAFSVTGPDVANNACRSTELWLRLVLPGEFWMGSKAEELGRGENEDFHHVKISAPFYIGMFEVTQRQWELVMGGKPSHFVSTENSPLRPVENITYYDVRGQENPSGDSLDSTCFLAKLRTRTKTQAFDLPTEAQWEFACRAGTMTALYTGENITFVSACAAVNKVARNFANGWSDAAPDPLNEMYGTAVVGSYIPNQLGLYDMIGNVWEFCRDGANENEHLGFQEVVDPLCANYFYDNGGGWGSHRTYRYYIARGGAYDSKASTCRAASRMEFCAAETFNGITWRVSTICGFRVAAEPQF